MWTSEVNALQQILDKYNLPIEDLQKVINVVQLSEKRTLISYLDAKAKLKKLKYPKFENVSRYLYKGDTYGVIKETPLAMLYVSIRNPGVGFWIAVRPNAGNGEFKSVSDAFPYTKAGYQQAKQCFERYLVNAMAEMKKILKAYTETI